ncbi:nectin-4 [Paramormyrops kingsleyae]|uniref:Nectin cell adhesion molecule 4 n=1 Tax=Paramormyrops kingsleyae TaxID=1676925 RepID=A0A3B3S2U5_9TELE|nr:nectin-4 [Paramormyrops kingsleyae]XP_023670523.1 nectin-4 [Paramormyrops kingsleyae]
MTLRLPVGLFVLWVMVPSIWGQIFVEPPAGATVRTVTEGPTRLPCQFHVDGQKVVQVSWSKAGPDGSRDTVIAAHHSEGHTEYGPYSGHVYFENSNPIQNSALIIRNTDESDEGIYICHIATFPSGSFEVQMSLIVWVPPISSLDPIEMVEGQTYRVAATCRAVARPMPRLSWDTDQPGQASNRSSGPGSVSSYFSLHPLRGMNGKKLDCLVWHPTLDRPRRIQNSLVVHYPPDATVSGFDENWYVGLEQASLRCNSRGHPKPHSFTWTRNGGPPPKGVTVRNETLIFGRPLTLEDAGRYHCMAQNSVGMGKADVEVKVSEFPPKPTFDSLLMIIAGVVIGVLVVVMVISVVLVNRYHKRKNKKLEMELTERKEEITTLSRQASFRRMHTVNADHHIQAEDCVPLRVEGTIRSSLSSLTAEQGRSRDSHSTLSGGRGGLDSLGRPVIFNSSRRGERTKERDFDREVNGDETLLRVNSIDSRLPPAFHPPLLPSLPPFERTADLRLVNGKAGIPGCDRAQHSPLNSAYPLLTDEEDEEEHGQEDGEKHREHCNHNGKSNSTQISEALNNNFHYSNGTLRPKPLANAILIHPKGQIV